MSNVEAHLVGIQGEKCLLDLNPGPLDPLNFNQADSLASFFWV